MTWGLEENWTRQGKLEESWARKKKVKQKGVVDEIDEYDGMLLMDGSWESGMKGKQRACRYGKKPGRLKAEMEIRDSPVASD